jgi:hypothetical protein
MFLSCFAFFNLILAGRGILEDGGKAVENEEAQRKREV